MKRPYQDAFAEAVEFFVGQEVEHTPLIGRRTLFVVGLHPAEVIIAQAAEQNAEAVYLGANQSFDATPSQDWDQVIRSLLRDSKLWVTLDFDVSYVEWVADGCYCENDRFVPMISVKIPYIAQMNYNATLKIDDKGFAVSNPGVWCHRLHNLMDTKLFTNWQAYTKDQPL